MTIRTCKTTSLIFFAGILVGFGIFLVTQPTFKGFLMTFWFIFKMLVAFSPVGYIFYLLIREKR